MIFFKSKAIVLHRYLQGSQKDIIVKFMSPQYGLVVCRARGAAASKRRFVNALEPGNLCEIDFSFRKSRHYYHLDELRVIKRFIKPGEINKTLIALCILETAGLFTRPAISNQHLWFNTISALNYLLQDASILHSLGLYLLKILKGEGLLPELIKCTGCNEKIVNNDYYFFMFHDSLKCKKCHSRNERFTWKVKGFNLAMLDVVLNRHILAKKDFDFFHGAFSMSQVKNLLLNAVSREPLSTCRSLKIITSEKSLNLVQIARFKQVRC